MTLIVFWPAGGYEFLHYDDSQYITENRHVQSGFNKESFRWAFTTGHSANWHPLTWLSHMLDVQLFGMNSFGHHLSSVFLHAVNTSLLFMVLSLMTGSIWKSALVAMLFAFHPLHVESVAWISERKDVLSTLFWLLTTSAYYHYIKKPGVFRYLSVMFLFLLGLMAKPMLVTLPFVLLLLDYWPFKRISIISSPEHLTSKYHPLILLLEKIPLLALSVASSVITYLVQQKGGAVRSMMLYPSRTRLANAAISYISYLYKMFFPHKLAVIYPYPLGGIVAWQLVLSLAVIFGLTTCVILLGRKIPSVFVGWFWYLGTLIPVIGLVQVGSQAMADRYTYVPLIGIFIALIWALDSLTIKWRPGFVAYLSAALILIATLIFLTNTQLQYWRNDKTLFSHALEVTKDNWMAHNALGRALADEGNTKDAFKHYSEALRIRPDFAEAHINIGLIYHQNGYFQNAISHYRIAIRSYPNLAEAHNNLGAALYAQSRYEEATVHLREALEINPEFGNAYNNLGLIMVKKNQTSEAIRYFSKSLELQPNSPEVMYNLAYMLSKEGRVNEAIVYYRRLLEIDPGNPEVRSALEKALSSQ